MKYNITDDTIAAISTALSPSGIGIIRVSGPDAIQIVDRIFCFENQSKHSSNGKCGTEIIGTEASESVKNAADVPELLEDRAKESKSVKGEAEKPESLEGRAEESKSVKGEAEIAESSKCEIRDSRMKKRLSDVKSHTIHYGKIVKEGIAYDEVLVSVMRSPNTYTREDVVEINCHGGPFVCRKVLDLVLAAGARCAEPGEFTKRAFLNGRLKLTEAEAVMDVISAENDYALQNGVSQLSGSVQKEIRKLRETLLGEIAYIEAALDDPEHMSLDGYAEALAAKTDAILAEMEKLIRQADNGRIMKEGVKTAIVGRPNVGKSSLLNALIGENRAIVTDIAGTTRDTLEENIYFHGITLHLIDTAGIRRTENVVEKIGVERAVEAVKRADLVLFVVDGSETLTQEDLEIWNLVREKKTILVRNKSDLTEKTENENNRKSVKIERKILEECREKDIPVTEISAKTMDGLDTLEEQVENMFYMEKIQPNTQVYITNARQKEALMAACDSMKLVKKSIEDGMPEDFFSIDLTDAYESLGKMIGETLEDDVAEQIFSKFCMGK